MYPFVRFVLASWEYSTTIFFGPSLFEYLGICEVGWNIGGFLHIGGFRSSTLNSYLRLSGLPVRREGLGGEGNEDSTSGLSLDN